MRILTTILLLTLSLFVHGQESRKSGYWSDPTTWLQGKVPSDSTNVFINDKHTVTLSGNASAKDVIVNKGGTLAFHQYKQASTLKVNGNVEIYGRLIHKVSSTYDSIIFIGIKESDFVGGGMGVKKTDRGLWVRGNGIIDISGQPKTEWANIAGSAYAKDKTISLNVVPKLWRVGDEISIAPTNPTSVKDHYKQFDVRTIVNIVRNLVTLDRPLSYDHPATLNPFTKEYYTAEVMNLTRTFYIGGTGDGSASPENNGRAHINIMNNAPSFIRYTEIRHMAPRQPDTLDKRYTTETLGRYPLHFHHCMYGSWGSLVEGTVVRNSGGHAYVPHASHGVTFKRNIAFDTYEHQYWWDVPPDRGKDTMNNSHFIVFDSCIGAKLKADPEFRGYRDASFYLGSGIGNEVTNSISIGVQGYSGASGYFWPEASNHSDNLWVSKNLLSHNNNSCGLFTWQNDLHPHTIDNFTAYNCNIGIEHGAYKNGYKYKNNYLFNNGTSILVHANAVSKGVQDDDGYAASFVNIKATDPLHITRHFIYDFTPTLFKDCMFPKVIVNEYAQVNPRIISGWYDFVNCDLKPEQFDIIRMEAGSLIRVQNGKEAFQITPGGIKKIPPFSK